MVWRKTIFRIFYSRYIRVFELNYVTINHKCNRLNPNAQSNEGKGKQSFFCTFYGVSVLYELAFSN